MREPTQTNPRANRRRPNHQRPAHPNLPKERRRQRSRPASFTPDTAAGETCQTPTFTLPAHAGLVLPRLTGIPTTFDIDNEQAQTAALALSLLEHGLIDDSDGDGTRPTQLIQNALARHVACHVTRSDLDLAFRLIRLAESDVYYLLVFIDGVAVISFDHAAQVLDALDPKLGPSLLGHVSRNLDLTPAFTPEVTLDYIRCFVWHGEDDDTALLQMAIDELEHQFDGDENGFTEEDARSYASEHFLTVAKVNERLEPRYQAHGGLSLRACKRRCTEHGLKAVLPLIETLECLSKTRDALPELDREIYDHIEGEMPYGLIVTLGGEHDLVREMYGEMEQMVWQSGLEFQPTYALAFDPNEPESLDRVRDALAVCSCLLEETEKLYEHLEGLTCL